MKRLTTILMLLVAPSLSFSGTTGKLAGRVTDAATGEGVVGATVLVDGTSLGAAADVDGYYTILNISPGSYSVSSMSVGYVKQTVEGINIQVDLTTTVNFRLVETVLQVGEEVVVTAERPLVRKDLTSTESRVGGDEIKTLPVTEVQDVLSLQSGITLGSDGGIHIRGGRTSEVAYWVDGVSVSDVYDGSQAVQVENNAVQELQVISGTFNAEYGQAMSGIVNIVTKDGGSAYHGNLSMYMGDYVTSDGWTYDSRVIKIDGSQQADLDPSGLFYNLNDLDPVANRNIEGSLSGPIPGLDDITFYVSGRFFRTNGWLYGSDIFRPDGNLNFDPTDRLTDFVPLNTGDTIVYVPTGLSLPDIGARMNWRERLSGQAKLTFNFSGSTKLSLTGIGSRIEYRDYNHEYFLTPDGDVTKYDRGYNLTGLWTHSLGSTSFYTAALSYFNKNFQEYLYEEVLDPRYIVDPNFAAIQSYEWRAGGTNTHRFQRRTETRSAKLDYTNQVSRLHQLKFGLEGRLHRLYLEDYNLTFDEATFQSTGAYVPVVPAVNGPLYEEYTREPIELSGYVQDKLEYEQMVVNIGVRFDYFDPRAQVLVDPSDPNVYLPRRIEHQFHDTNGNGTQDPGETSTTLDERLGYWYKDATVKTNISPRLGISYPITDRGILHFSYGHFLQIPSFIHLYQKPGYKVTTASGIQGVYGNPDLEAQKTTMYELGLQQQLTDDLSFDATLFYRDTRDWVTTSPSIDVGDPGSSTSSYVMYVNRDYANARGVTISVTKRPSNLWSLNIAYTFQIAEGINSNPDDELAAQRDNTEPSRSLTPLDWDQTHTANVTLGIGEPDWGVYLIGRYGSGLPYTPTVNQAESQGADAARIVSNNSRRRPSTLNFDVRLFKNFRLDPLDIGLFLRVFNLFDRRNEVTVYGETGRANATVESLGIGEVSGDRLNPVSAYIVRPDYYSEPREIQLGLEVTF